MAGVTFGRAVMSLASQPAVKQLAVRSPLTHALVTRFVAGETLDDALDVVRELNARHLLVALDHLGENTTQATEAVAATGEAIRSLDRVDAAALDAYVSVKLTQLGLDVGEQVVLDNAVRLLERAQALHRFVRIDMEGSSYTARTIELYEQLRHRFDNVGLVLQAYLYRTQRDVERLTAAGASIRLCKGAYSEPPHISFRRKRDTDRNYVRLMEYLLVNGIRPALATHDEQIVKHAIEFTQAHNIDPGRFEFQMLYGIRRDLQDDLARRGYTVRVYVPYGSEWYPYLTRRLAERPANALFVLKNLARDRQGPEPAADHAHGR